jgi:hypothetical protein
MIEEKDRYGAPTTRPAAGAAAIPAGNRGQKAVPADKFTESLHAREPAALRPRTLNQRVGGSSPSRRTN